MIEPSLFKRDFDEEQRQEAESRLVQPAPSYSADDLASHAETLAAQARSDGHAAGVALGKREAEAGFIAAQTVALQDLRAKIDLLLAGEAARHRQIEADALGFLLDLADKFLPDLVTHIGAQRVSDELRKVVQAAQGSPWLDVTVPADLLDRIKQDFADLDDDSATRRGGPQITWHGSDTLSQAAIQARWQDGRADYDFAKACGSAIDMIEAMKADLEKGCSQND